MKWVPGWLVKSGWRNGVRETVAGREPSIQSRQPAAGEHKTQPIKKHNTTNKKTHKKTQKNTRKPIKNTRQPTKKHTTQPT